MLTEVENRVVMCPVTREPVDWMECSKSRDVGCDRCVHGLSLYQRE